MVKKTEFSDMPHKIDPRIKNAPAEIWYGAKEAFEKWQLEFGYKIISVKDAGWPGLTIEVWYDDFKDRAIDWYSPSLPSSRKP
jgi:hypothetical protein